MVPRLWVPLSHWLWARNWNWAASGAALTASRVAKRVAVSTPLRVGSLTVVVISVLLRCLRGARRGWMVQLIVVRSGAGEFALAWNGAGGHLGRLGVDGLAELLLQVDELGYRRVRGEGTGELEDLPQRVVALALIAGQGGALVGAAAHSLVEGDGEQLGVPVGVAEAIAGDRVPVVAGVADQRPAAAMSSAQLVGQPQHPG